MLAVSNRLEEPPKEISPVARPRVANRSGVLKVHGAPLPRRDGGAQRSAATALERGFGTIGLDYE